jgi:hypothetical protein
VSLRRQVRIEFQARCGVMWATRPSLAFAVAHRRSVGLKADVPSASLLVALTHPPRPPSAPPFVPPPSELTGCQRPPIVPADVGAGYTFGP